MLQHAGQNVESLNNALIQNEFILDDVAPCGESERMEFKQSFSAENTGACRRTMNAFLNTHGGHIIFGVTDIGIVSGLMLGTNQRWPQGELRPQKAIDSFKLWVDQTQSNIFTPAVHSITVQTKKLSKDRWLWIIDVPKSEIPIYYKGMKYRRLNASTVVDRSYSEHGNVISARSPPVDVVSHQQLDLIPKATISPQVGTLLNTVQDTVLKPTLQHNTVDAKGPITRLLSEMVVHGCSIRRIQGGGVGIPASLGSIF